MKNAGYQNKTFTTKSFETNLKRVKDCKQIKKDHCGFIKRQDTKYPRDSKERNEYNGTLYSKSKQTENVDYV